VFLLHLFSSQRENIVLRIFASYYCLDSNVNGQHAENATPDDDPIQIHLESQMLNDEYSG
jgi:hypothetical protein